MFRRKRKFDDFKSEIEAHLKLETERLQEQGFTYEEARAAAHHAFGNVTKAQERFYESGRWLWLDHLWQDVRFALRMLRKSPGFTAVAILTLALGIGANTVIFSIVSGVLLNPLPYSDPSHLVSVYGVAPDTSQGYVTYLNFLDWQRMNRTFSSMAMYRYEDYNFTGSGSAERVSGSMISADFFQTLGIQPILGRLFRPSDDQLGAAPVVILGGGFWKRRFAASPNVLGKSLALNGASYTVIGVIPASFTFYGPQREVYIPIGQWNDPSFRSRAIDVSSHVIGRLKPGITLAQAQADMSRVARDLARAYPDADKGVGIALISLKRDLVGNVQPFLLLLLVAVGFLLLIACANVANLLLARSLGRSHEFAIRAALGASHPRVIRQLLTESILLAGLGGALGLLLAFSGLKAALAFLPATLPRSSDVSLDPHVLLFTLVASLFAGILFGLAPALKTSRVDLQRMLNQSIRGSSPARHRLQGTFVAVQVALALVLLVGAGLMLRSFSALWSVNPGFNPRHAITFDLSLPDATKATSAETRARLRAFDAKMLAIPGVEAVSVTLGSRPMIHDTVLPFWIQGRPKPEHINDMPQAMCYLAQAGFRKAMGITLERGRFITPQDNEYAPIVVDVDDYFARTYFPNESPIGQRINIADFDVQAKIVGVIAHVKQWGPSAHAAIQAQIYYPFMQIPEKLMPLVASAVAVVLRTQGDSTRVMPEVRRAVAELNPNEVIYDVQTLDEVISNSFAARRLSMILLAIFAALALLLACVGIYGVVSYLAVHRTREIGLRMALGAQREDILRLILGRGLRMAFIGVIAGALAALALTRLMASELFGVTPHDPLTFLAVAVLLTLVALLACYIPARRAMRVDPMVALRYE